MRKAQYNIGDYVQATDFISALLNVPEEVRYHLISHICTQSRISSATLNLKNCSLQINTT